jgi:hypothetical protein
MAFYQNEDSQWVSLGHIIINGIDQYPYIGLSAYHGVSEIEATSITVDFDYTLVRPIEVWGNYLPFIQSGS